MLRLTVRQQPNRLVSVKPEKPSPEEMRKAARRFQKFERKMELDRLQWLLKLIQLPAEELHKHGGQARYLSDRLAIFSNYAPEGFRPLRSSQIKRLVAEIREGMYGLRSGKPWEVRVPVSIRLQPLRKGNSQVTFNYIGDLSAAFLSSAIQRLGAHFDRIAKCEASGCERLFVKRKATRYCSRKCSQRMRSSRYYELHREQLRKRRHDAYVERIRQEKGAARVVQTRKRREPRRE